MTKVTISAGDVRGILKETKLGKLVELDRLSAEHFAYSHSSVIVHVSLLFTCILNHGYIPSVCMKTSIILF